MEHKLQVKEVAWECVEEQKERRLWEVVVVKNESFVVVSALHNEDYRNHPTQTNKQTNQQNEGQTQSNNKVQQVRVST
jgi:hypothetical protein